MLKTSAITLFVAFVTFAYGLAIFGWVFPGVMADLSVRIGAHNAAGMYFERVYDRDRTPDNLYYALDRYILANNHGKVVILGGKFLDLDGADQTRIIETVNEEWRIRAGGSKHNLVAWANEDSRIKRAYTIALIRTGKTDEAIAKLETWLAEPIDLDQPNRAFIEAYFIADTYKTKELLEDYMSLIEGTTGFDESIFTLGFLMEANARLHGPTHAQTVYYLGLFYDYIL